MGVRFLPDQYIVREEMSVESKNRFFADRAEIIRSMFVSGSARASDSTKKVHRAAESKAHNGETRRNRVVSAASQTAPTDAFAPSVGLSFSVRSSVAGVLDCASAPCPERAVKCVYVWPASLSLPGVA